MPAARSRVGVIAGGLLAAASLVGLILPATSLAQTGEPTTAPASVQRQAYYTAEVDGAVPATLTAEFPPGIVCILVIPACTAQAQQVTGPLGEIAQPVTNADSPDHLAPQPVQPGTLPVGMLGGKPRYTSYLKLTLPDLPQGSVVDRFDLIFTQGDLSYALESPAFRQAVLSGLVAYQTSDPTQITNFLAAVANQQSPLLERTPTGIELCAVTAPWPAGASQDASTQPPRDCIFGANGQFDPVGETWTFDLAFLAQAWLDGTTPNEGIYLGPIGAANLAFGDPDTSTNWQVSLNGADTADAAFRPRIRYSVSEAFDETATFDDEADLSIGEESFDGGFDDGVVESVDPFLSTTFDDSALTGGDAGGSSAGDVGAPTTRARRVVLAGESSPRSPWWLWLLLPSGLALAYVFGRGLEETPASRRAGSGALTRLMSTTGSPAG